MGMFDRLLRAGEGRKVRAIQALVPDVNALEPELEQLRDDQLRARTTDFRNRIDRGEPVDDLLIEAFAVVREAAQRTIHQRHYDVQLMGAAALHFGWIAEMKTGEGKTLVSTLPVYLNGLTGNGVHVITVNDYLAKRDADWMGQIHRWLGLDVGLVIPEIRSSADKRIAYGCDITYGVNNEFGFDYLRDNMALSTADKVQRGHAYGIVDEVDSILIDEARTPLIISGRVADAAKLYYRFASIVRGLERDVDYDVDEEKRHVAPTDDGVEKVEASLGVENLYDELSSNLVHQLQAALRAKELYKRDKDYIVTGGEVKIVDEFTGRILEGRRWSEGLHQAVEAKEGVRIKEENQTLATITLQNYFRLYDKLAGMTGTAQTEAAELANTYNLQVVPTPTHKPMVRQDQPDLIYKTKGGKWKAVVAELKDRHERGQPVLVGTVSVEKSERLSNLLTKRGVPHEVLNAKQHTREAEIVAQAGRLGSVTVATNMAGRGVDIILGGNPEGLARREARGEGLDPGTVEFEARFAELEQAYEDECRAEGDKVRDLGGLYVLGTERHESRRIDNQLRGRSGRQGDPGESRFYLSFEDELLRLFGGQRMQGIIERIELEEDVPIEAGMISNSVRRAQEQVESRNFQIRKRILEYDDVLNKQREVIYAIRRDILMGEDVDTKSYVDEVLTEVVSEYVSENVYPEDWDLDALTTEVNRFYPSRIDFKAIDVETLTAAEVLAMVLQDADERLEERKAEWDERTAELERRGLARGDGVATFEEAERRTLLSVVDSRWREHLYEMDYLREGIGWRGLSQRDPLVEYKREGFDIFQEMERGLKADYVTYIYRVENIKLREEEMQQLSYSGGEEPNQRPKSPRKTATKIGRNEPCPCGSGKKYKKCHGQPGAPPLASEARAG